MTVDEVERMVTVCRNAKVCFDEGVMWYHHPRAAKMQRVVASGRLGQIRRVTSAFSFPWQSTVKPEDEYRLRAEEGGGSLMDLGWYCIGAALWVFGSLPESVQGRQTPAAPEADESFSGWLHFSEHQEAFFDCSRTMTSRRWIEIAGTEGSLVCDDFTRPWKEDKCRFWVHDAQGNAEVVESATDNQETCMIENFSQRVLSGEIDPEQGKRALQTQRVVEALQLSARDRQPVDLQS
ncbi:Gfo/Idh/MocA family protein [Rubinisphaera margarita]|uniref:Gfo/Idh/MocA family protein n=1 Tax=Rubinisphaera margarita TaxID=2909586 RepID=UPI001EE859B6|nr:Gfo/Idh/MocA family oxidoreductase [Rubinisphaera margarita]MCG6157074.1 Gfo/Idh/MocA family oxidoreductase [Rubinisphaera margarita]